MNRSNYGLLSCLLFVVVLVIFILTSTVFDAALGNLSFTTQRWIGLVTLVLPALSGAVLGGVGLLQPDTRRGWAWVGLILHGLWVVVFAAILSFAG